MQIGSKVLCTNDFNWTEKDFLYFDLLPVQGHVYVVRSVIHNDSDPFCSPQLTLVGIKGEMIFVKDDHKNLIYMEAHFSGDRFMEILSPVIFPELYPGVFNFNNDEIQIKFYTPDVDLQDCENYIEPDIPPCPFCADESGECAHVLLNIDKSANVCFTGFMYDSKKTDMLKHSIGGIIQEGRTPEFNSDSLELIWQTAMDSYNLASGFIDLDYANYYDLLDECYDELGCTAYRYYTRNYNSFYDIYFAENPEETVEAFHRYILDELNAH